MLTTTMSCARHIPHTPPQPSPHACHQAPPASTGEDRPGFLWCEGLMRPKRQSLCVTSLRTLGEGWLRSLLRAVSVSTRVGVVSVRPPGQGQGSVLPARVRQLGLRNRSCHRWMCPAWLLVCVCAGQRGPALDRDALWAEPFLGAKAQVAAGTGHGEGPYTPIHFFLRGEGTGGCPRALKGMCSIRAPVLDQPVSTR